MKKILTPLFFGFFLCFANQTVAQSDLPLIFQHLDPREDAYGLTTYYYKDTLFTGYTQNISSTGMCREMVFENGLIQQQLGWYANGNVERNFSFKNGRPHGKLIGYYEDGKTKYFEENYINGVQEGVQQGWNSDGSLRYIEHRASGTVISRMEYEKKGKWKNEMDDC